MAEYIERDKAVQVAIGACVGVCKDITDHGITHIHGVEIAEKIEKIPAADVVEVVHGEWINDFGSYSTMHCSKCEWRVPYIEDYWAIQELYSSLHNCPNCGAKMDAERKCEDG